MEERRHLGEPEDEDQVEEQLERCDPMLGFDEALAHAATLTRRRRGVSDKPRLSSASQSVRELRTRLDAELPEHFAQVVLDRARADEQLSGDLPVRVSLGHEARDLGFLWCQLAERIHRSLSGMFSGRLELDPCAFGELYGVDHLPTEGEIVELAERWRPYRSLAVSYLFASEFEEAR
jgi:hypothetical protein